MAGTHRRSRERSGLGLRPNLSSSDRERSCSATRWQAQPQKKRPNTAVRTIVTAKKISPKLTTPETANAAASEGSTGVKVLPFANQCAMCAAMARWISTSTAARRGELRDGRMRFFGWMTGKLDMPRRA